MTLDHAQYSRAAAAAAHRERDLAQRRANLDRAQAVRLELAAIKDEVHADASWLLLVGLVAGHVDRPHAARLRVGELLVCAAGIGPVKGRTLLHKAGVRSPRRRLDELPARQREALAAGLLEQRRRLTDAAIERYSTSPRHATRRP